MKKIPTLFKREYDPQGRIVNTLNVVTPGFEWVLAGEGEATEKIDGSCCAIIDGKFYKRFDAKEGRKIPLNAIPCQKMRDPYTGHFPHWIPVELNSNKDRWFAEAYYNTVWATQDGTYEAVGVHFQGNPYDLDADFLEPHGRIKIKDCPRDYEGIKEYLRTHDIEGIVFWKDGKPGCKIKRSDFGFAWNGKGERK